MANPSDRTKKRREFAPGTRQLQRPTRRTPTYKVIAVGVYDDQAQSLDRAATDLQHAGYLKANRSFVVQALVRRLQNEIEGLTSDQLLEMFFETYVKRPLSSAPPRLRSSVTANKIPDQRSARRHRA